MKKRTSLDRRDFLRLFLGAMAAGAVPVQAVSATLKTFDAFDARRTLAFYNIHTREHLDVCYFEQGNYKPAALSEIDYILRDHRSKKVKPIDVELLDVLFSLKSRIRPRSPFSIISGYRSPATNEMLRRHTTGVAKDSFHTTGQAIDIRLPGYNTAALKNLCLKLHAGGVGYYAKSDFVHLDVGPVRSW